MGISNCSHLGVTTTVQQQNRRKKSSHMENVMVSKAAMKFSQNHPVQHKKLLDVIQTVQSSNKQQSRHRQQVNVNTRQSWSSGMSSTVRRRRNNLSSILA